MITIELTLPQKGEIACFRLITAAEVAHFGPLAQEDINRRGLVCSRWGYTGVDLIFMKQPDVDEILLIAGYNYNRYDCAVPQDWFADQAKRFHENNLQHPRFYVWSYQESHAFGTPLNIPQVFREQFMPRIVQWIFEGGNTEWGVTVEVENVMERRRELQ